MATTYSLAKVINVVVMTIAAPVFYFWARRLVAPLLAVIGVVLVLAMPAFIYTGELMTENAFFPAFHWPASQLRSPSSVRHCSTS